MGVFLGYFSRYWGITYKLNIMAKITLTPSQQGFLQKTLQEKLDSLKTYDLYLHEASTISFYERNQAAEIRVLDIEDCLRKQIMVQSILEALS